MHRLTNCLTFVDVFRVLHTTKQVGECIWVTQDEFSSLVKQGCFVCTFTELDHMYGLSLEAIEFSAVSQKACIVALSLEVNNLHIVFNKGASLSVSNLQFLVCVGNVVTCIKYFERI